MTMFHLGNIFGCCIVSFQILFFYSHMIHMLLVKIWKFNWEINPQLFNFIALFYDLLTYKLLGTQIYFFTNTSKKSELNAYKKKKKKKKNRYTIYN